MEYTSTLNLEDILLNESIPIKDYINKDKSHEIKFDKLFSEFIVEMIIRKRKRNKPSFEKVYNTLLHHLDIFCSKFNVVLYTNSINEEFLDDFIIYLESCNYKAGYINHLLSLIKAMLVKAAKYNYAVDSTYDDVTVLTEDTYSIYLSTNQITRIYYYKGLTKKQEKVRDLFIVGCLTALRYSDYSTLTRENFKDGFIYKTQKKTNREVIIPVHDYITEIYNKYDGNLSFGLTIQHFNRYIKRIIKKIGLSEPVTFTYHRGGELITETRPMYEMVGSHTARRSAATNMLLSGRFSMFQIMSYTGHSTERSLKRYLRLSIQDIASQMSGDMYFKK